MKYITWIAATIGGVVLLGLLGLAVKPSPFAAPARVATPKPVRLVPIPAGLPAPVDRWYRAEFPQGLPVYDTVVMRGTGTMRIAGRRVAVPPRRRGTARSRLLSQDGHHVDERRVPARAGHVRRWDRRDEHPGRPSRRSQDRPRRQRDQLARAACRSGRTCRESSGSLGAHRRRTQRDWSSRSRTQRTASSSGSTRRPAIQPPRAPIATVRPIPPRRPDGSQR